MTDVVLVNSESRTATRFHDINDAMAWVSQLARTEGANEVTVETFGPEPPRVHYFAHGRPVKFYIERTHA